MAAKTVTIESKDYVFNTLKEAQKYYNAIVKELYDAKLILTTGQDFEDLKWIYTTSEFFKVVVTISRIKRLVIFAVVALLQDSALLALQARSSSPPEFPNVSGFEF